MPINADLCQEQWMRFSYCRDRGHLDFVAKADKCDKFFVGEQWLAQDLNMLNLQRRPAITINKILSTISTILGDQIMNRTEVLFRPANGSPAEVADALSKVWMQISQNNQLPWLRSDVFCDGVIRGRGFYDVRLDFTDSMQGEVRISLVNSKNVIVDPDAEEYDPDAWNDVFTTKWATFQDLSTLYSKEDAKYLRDKEGSAFPYGYDSIERVRDRFAGPMPMGGYVGLADPDGVRRNMRILERQHRKLDSQLHFVDIETGDMRPVPHEWERDQISMLLEKAQGKLSTTKKMVKRIRWTVTCDNVCLHDEWSPYKHFTIVPYFPLFRYGKTVGIVENLLGPQEILNKASSQELHVVNTTANSGWIVEQDSLVNMSVEELEAKGATTGLVVEFKKGAEPPEKITPNQTPTGLDRITYKAEEHIKSISNVTDSMQGNDREDVAAKAIAYKQQRSSVNHSKVLDNLERTDWILARNTLAIVQEYYSEERLITIIHEDFTRENESVTVNQQTPTGEIVNDLTIGEYDIVITSSPFRNSLEDSQFEQARALKELGLPIPDSVLIENSRLMRRSEILKEMEKDKNSPEAQARAERAVRMEEAEVGGAEADIQVKQATAAKTMADAKAAGGQEDLMKLQAEIEKMQQEAALEREAMANELTMAREEHALKIKEMEEKIRLKEVEFEQKAAFKAEEHQQDMVAKRQESALRLQQQEQQAEQNEGKDQPETSNTLD